MPRQVNRPPSKQIAFSRDLRKRSTDAEVALWRALRSREMQGLKFRRQHPRGRYILDFFCVERGLVIELDGSQHFEAEQAVYDAARTRFLEAEGLQVLRFDDRQVLTEMDAVLEAILLVLETPSP